MRLGGKFSIKIDSKISIIFKIQEIQSRVNDMRGKFIVPPLKKVSKYQTQLEKMRQWTYKLAKMDMRGGLKPVKKEYELDDSKLVSDRIGSKIGQYFLNKIDSFQCLIN